MDETEVWLAKDEYNEGQVTVLLSLTAEINQAIAVYDPEAFDLTYSFLWLFTSTATALQVRGYSLAAHNKGRRLCLIVARIYLDPPRQQQLYHSFVPELVSQ